MKSIVISRGTACKCGGGFCAMKNGIGFYGTCRGESSNKTTVKDCSNCGAPYQGNTGCWLCNGDKDKDNSAWLLLLANGIHGNEVFDYQDSMIKKGHMPSFQECVGVLVSIKNKGN